MDTPGLSEVRVLPAVLGLAATYYATTLSLWVGHWFSHLGRSPFRGFHLTGHHTFYPTSRRILSERFLYGRGKASSIFALLPWLVLQALIALVLLPRGIFVLCLAETVLVVALMNYIHTQFHLRRTWLARFGWFLEARRLHAHHHDEDANFMVADHLWDRVMGTFDRPGQQPGGPTTPKGGLTGARGLV